VAAGLLVITPAQLEQAEWVLQASLSSPNMEVEYGILNYQ
jgi:hypothetical protein